ncbi:23S rRNA (pseudouridine(1915)-N(3))-methyltransferase RlmH [candidate division KSB1 bacterium]|nr:23S rRNA (pseudouridine(1915)-N(3))-methyltransferase RlmH [candidate division KSB1 bacterium]RQW02587.1 MAG: 23S rRNA (pseudouridine(1915)-N(3))-methyltransferase RlmH [candidate division KSB1 bacterium]
MKIQIIIAGKVDNSSLNALANMYLKRINYYSPAEFVQIKPEKIKSLSEAVIKNREGSKILEKVSGSDFVVVLDRKGRQYSSKEFSQVLNRVAVESRKQLIFIIGGPLGVHDIVKQRADAIISFSKMTFPHELAAVMVLEQIYRAFSILRGEKYHK